jgi:hypothetical protein
MKEPPTMAMVTLWILAIRSIRMTDVIKYKVLESFPHYKIYENGCVVSCSRDVSREYGFGGKHIMSIQGKTLKHTRHSGGYLTASVLNSNGTLVKMYVHRLVALAFLPNPQDLPLVNHIDGDKANNHVSNLEWSTYSLNLIHDLKLNNYTRTRRKLSVDQYNEVLHTHMVVGRRSLASKFNVSITTIQRVVTGVYSPKTMKGKV